MHRTITLALRDAGLEKPYDLEFHDGDATAEKEGAKVEVDEMLSEFEWAFGTGMEKKS